MSKYKTLVWHPKFTATPLIFLNKDERFSSSQTPRFGAFRAFSLVGDGIRELASTNAFVSPHRFHSANATEILGKRSLADSLARSSLLNTVERAAGEGHS